MKKRLLQIWQEKGIGAALLPACFLLLLLQLWRPLFFLTDDSFALAFPVWVSVGQNLWSGHNPFISPDLFGGDYPLYRDSQMIVLWHPAALLLSLLSPTFLRNTLVDIMSAANVLLAVAGFRWLLKKWSAAGLIRVGGGAAVFLSLSYGFSLYSLLLGSSGFWYLANVAALPWLAGAWWEKNPRKLFGIVVPAAFHTAVGGYPSCFVYSMLLVLFLGTWKLLLEKELRPFLLYLTALSIAALLSMPMILPSLLTLAESTRSGPIAVDIASEHRMPASVLLASAFLGSGSILVGHFELFGKLLHAYALASFAASGLALAAFWKKEAWWNAWDLGLLVLLAAAVLLISRPDWLGRILQHLPVLGSLRWPHKEIFLFVFLLHLWAARGSSLNPKVQNLAAFACLLVFLASLTVAGPPSLNEHAASRRLLLNGEAGKFWAGIREKVKPGEQIIPLVPDDLMEDLPSYFKLPLILTGGGNFPAMYGVKSWSGYSATMPRQIFEREPHPSAVVGLYSQKDRETLEGLPGVVFLHLIKARPALIMLEKEGQKPVVVWGE